MSDVRPSYFWRTTQLLRALNHGSTRTLRSPRSVNGDGKSRAGCPAHFLATDRALVIHSLCDDPILDRVTRLGPAVSEADLIRSVTVAQEQHIRLFSKQLDHVSELLVVLYEVLYDKNGYYYVKLKQRFLSQMSNFASLLQQKTRVMADIAQSRSFGRAVALTRFQLSDVENVLLQSRVTKLMDRFFTLSKFFLSSAPPLRSRSLRVASEGIAEATEGKVSTAPVHAKLHDKPATLGELSTHRCCTISHCIATVLKSLKRLIFIITFGLALHIAVKNRDDPNSDVDKIFEGFGEIVLGWWLVGALVVSVNQLAIPYAHLFNLPVGTSWSSKGIFDSAMTVSMLFVSTFLLYQYSLLSASPAIDDAAPSYNTTVDSFESQDILEQMRDGIASVCPLFFLIFCAVGVLALTLGCPCFRSRKFVWKTLPRVVVAPFCLPTFADSWVGDVLTSYTKAFNHVATLATSVEVHSALMDWGTCKETITSLHSNSSLVPSGTAEPASVADGGSAVDSTKVVTAALLGLPLWWRLMQNIRVFVHTRRAWPALANALKYAMALSLSIITSLQVHSGEAEMTGSLFITYVVCYVVATLYAFLWDIFMDWGLITFVIRIKSPSKSSKHRRHCMCCLAKGKCRIVCQPVLRHKKRRRFGLAVFVEY